MFARGWKRKAMNRNDVFMLILQKNWKKVMFNLNNMNSGKNMLEE